MRQTKNKAQNVELKAEYQGELSYLHALLRKLSSDWEQENERCTILFRHDPDAPHTWPFELALRPGEPSIADWSVGYELNSSNGPYPVGGIHAWQVREKGVHVIFTAHTSEAWRLIGLFYAEIIDKGHMTTDQLVIYPQSDVQVSEAVHTDSKQQRIPSVEMPRQEPGGYRVSLLTPPEGLNQQGLPPKGKPGRKPYPANERAWKRLCNGDLKAQVYADWCKDLQITDPDAKLNKELFNSTMHNYRKMVRKKAGKLINP
jgi:hypothetical protein